MGSTAGPGGGGWIIRAAWRQPGAGRSLRLTPRSVSEYWGAIRPNTRTHSKTPGIFFPNCRDSFAVGIGKAAASRSTPRGFANSLPAVLIAVPLRSRSRIVGATFRWRTPATADPGCNALSLFRRWRHESRHSWSVGRGSPGGADSYKMWIGSRRRSPWSAKRSSAL